MVNTVPRGQTRHVMRSRDELRRGERMSEYLEAVVAGVGDGDKMAIYADS